MQCSCPYVSRRLAPHGDAIAPMLLPFASPPVATAEYLRAVYSPSRLHLTYAGGCPSASHESIDVWLSPAELLAALSERGIVATGQPTEFDSVLPPDRRRFFSEPGGVPSRYALRHLPAPVEYVEVKADDFVVDVAQQLLSPTRALIDVSIPLGCCCSGATGAVSSEVARARVREMEPPRALAPIVDHSLKLPLDRSLPKSAVETYRAPPAAQPPLPELPAALEAPPAPAQLAVETIPRRRSPPGLTRPVLGTMPQARTDTGRQLPRAYVARRRSSPRGVRESAVRRVEPPTAPREVERRSRWWVLVGAIGVALGLGIAWLLRLAM